MTEQEICAAKEQLAIATLKNFLQENKELLLHIARWGDGECGYISDVANKILHGDDPQNQEKRHPKKAKLAGELRTQVFERDKYRCKHCGTHLNLSVDHIIPESKGGESTLYNLQTLCRSCNSRKGVKMPQELSV